jgi:hypothetical protein
MRILAFVWQIERRVQNHHARLPESGGEIGDRD